MVKTYLCSPGKRTDSVIRSMCFVSFTYSCVVFGLAGWWLCLSSWQLVLLGNYMRRQYRPTRITRLVDFRQPIESWRARIIHSELPGWFCKFTFQDGRLTLLTMLLCLWCSYGLIVGKSCYPRIVFLALLYKDVEHKPLLPHPLALWWCHCVALKRIERLFVVEWGWLSWGVALSPLAKLSSTCTLVDVIV